MDVYNSQSYLADTLDVGGMKTAYNEHAIRLLADREIIALILQACLPEVKNFSLDAIKACIDGEPEVSTISVKPDLENLVASSVKHYEPEKANLLSNEDISATEGKITYDVRLKIAVPFNGSRIRIYLNLEAQRVFNPGYRLESRGIYYGARMISSQMGRDFEPNNYDDIKKVYSIWICMRPDSDHKNRIFGIKFEPYSIYGLLPEVKGYDLINVIMICLKADPGRVTSEEISVSNRLIDMLSVLFSGKMTASEKKTILSNDYGIKMSQKSETEVDNMCNLAEGIWEEAEQTAKKIVEEKYSALIIELSKNGEIDKIEKVASDPEFRKEMFKKYGL